MATSPAQPDEALALVHLGWEHLRLQRPLAAWASWQQALRVEPAQRAAAEALERLAASTMLPEAAKRVYRLRGPEGEDRRTRWDHQLRGGDVAGLGNAGRVFEDLTASDPADAPAWYNLALCRAWRGENLAALAALHRFVGATAEADFDAAADAWALAEVLRHGAGAEEHADDLSWSVAISWDEGRGEPRRWLDAWPHREIAPIADPLRPASGPTRVFELLNEDHAPPRVEGTLIAGADHLLFSTLWPGPGRPWSEVFDEHRELLGLEGCAIDDPEARVLPLHLLDSQAWTFRLPEGLEAEHRARRSGAALIEYYRSAWAEMPRHGAATGEPDAYATEAPEEAAEAIRAGDRVAAAQLEGIIRLREQLARRPQVAPLYDFFSFDLVREALGLPPRRVEESEGDEP